MQKFIRFLEDRLPSKVFAWTLAAPTVLLFIAAVLIGGWFAWATVVVVWFNLDVVLWVIDAAEEELKARSSR